MTRIKLALLVAGGLALLAPRSADAGKVVVLGVDGDRSGELEQVLTTIVASEHDVVSNAAYKKAAKKAKVKGTAPKGVAKVAKKLAADAIVDGALGREDDAYLLTVRIRGKDGEVAQEVSIALKTAQLSEKARRKLGRQLLVALDSLGVVGREGADNPAPPPAEEPVDEPAPPPASATEEPPPAPIENSTELAAANDRRGIDSENPLPSKRADAGLAAAAPRRSGPARRTAIRLEVGASATARQLTFITRDGLDNPPFGYDSPPVPGLRVAADFYPFAFATSGVASGFGVGVEYDQVFGLTTRTAATMDVALPTTEALIAVGARFRYAFDDTETSPTVTLTGGYGQRVFTVDRTALPSGNTLDLPDVDYRFFDPGLSFRLPLGSVVAVSAGARGLLMMQSGPISDRAEYGTATITGVDADAGLELVLAPFLLHVSGRFTQIGHSFNGDGEQTTNRDGDPASQDIGGAYDRYLGGSATLGVIF